MRSPVQFIVFVLAILFTQMSYAEVIPDYTPVESPAVVESDKRLQEAEQKWTLYQQRLAWFLEYSRPFKKDTEEDLEATELKQEMVEQYRSLAEKVNQTQEAFLKFRTEVANCALIFNGNSTSGLLGYSLSTLQVTEWYIDYMQKLLFPYDWEKLYQEGQHPQTITTPDSLP